MTDSAAPTLPAPCARHAPSTLRNRTAIAVALARLLPASGVVLEVASGSGEHCAYFAEMFPRLIWLPSDVDAEARASIAAWCAGRDNVRAPIALDAAAAVWPAPDVDGVVCINMTHIAPWEATLGLLDGAARVLPPGGPLILYGPYLREGVETAPSNLEFDGWLKAQNPAWGLRSLDAVTAEAARRGFAMVEVSEMPANNITAGYRKLG